MDDSDIDGPLPRVDSLPERVEDGATVLVATAGDPTQYGPCLDILYQRGQHDDLALVVTTTGSAAGTVERYGGLGRGRDGPALALVDTVSEGQSVSAVYDETPVMFTPAPGDVERLVIALSDLTEGGPSASGDRHLVIRSLTPILEAASTDRVLAVLGRILGLRTGAGLCLLGIDYTAHDEATRSAIADRTDGVLWVTQPSSDQLAVEYEPSEGRYSFPQSAPGNQIQ